MTAVTTTALQYAMQYMNARYIQGTFRADNIASKRVLEKNGFAYLCEAKMPVRGGKEELEIVFNKTLAAE